MLNSDLLTSDSEHDSITTHSKPNVIGLDWERDGWRVSEYGKLARHVSRDDLLKLSFDSADYVVSEGAHFKERNDYSVAQVYTAEELRRLPFRHKLRLFPGMPGQLARASRDVGHVLDKVDKYGNPIPNKELDAETMAVFSQKYPHRLVSWKKFKLPDEDPSRRLWAARDEFRKQLCEALNPLRAAWNSMNTAEIYALPEVSRMCEILDKYYDQLGEGVREQFRIRRSRKGIRTDRLPAALTAYLCVYDREGNLRRNPSGGFIGIGFILKAVGLCNSYRPNMARSQLTHHGMRHYKGGRDGGYRSEYMRNLRHFLAILRDADLITGDSEPRLDHTPQ